MHQAASGRSLERETYWRGQIEAQQASGLSVRQFCRQRQLGEPSFYHWRRTLAARDGKSSSRSQTRKQTSQRAAAVKQEPPATLVPVTPGTAMASTMSTSMLEIMYFGNTRSDRSSLLNPSVCFFWSGRMSAQDPQDPARHRVVPVRLHHDSHPVGHRRCGRQG